MSGSHTHSMLDLREGSRGLTVEFYYFIRESEKTCIVWSYYVLNQCYTLNRLYPSVIAVTTVCFVLIGSR